MRNYFFTFKDETSRNIVFDSFFELFKNHDAFEQGRIIFCKTLEDGVNKIYLSIEDNVAGSFGIVTMNMMGSPLKIKFFAVGDEVNDFEVELPLDCTYGSTYDADITTKNKGEKKDDNKESGVSNKG